MCSRERCPTDTWPFSDYPGPSSATLLSPAPARGRDGGSPTGGGGAAGGGRLASACKGGAAVRGEVRVGGGRASPHRRTVRKTHPGAGAALAKRGSSLVLGPVGAAACWTLLFLAKQQPVTLPPAAFRDGSVWFCHHSSGCDRGTSESFRGFTKRSLGRCPSGSSASRCRYSPRDLTQSNQSYYEDQNP